MIFESIFRELNSKKVQYLVIGGIAVNLHGFPRATGDLDLLILLEESNIRRFLEVVKKLKLNPRVPVKLDDFADAQMRKKWVREKGMVVFSVFDPKQPMAQIDVMIEPVVDFKKAYKSREVVKAGRLPIPVVSIPDLIRLKKKANRERDRIDIEALRQIQMIAHGKKKKKQ